MSQLDLLQRLQEIDSDISQKKSRLGDVIRGQRETETLLSARSRAARAQAETTRLQTRQQDLNLQIRSLQTRIQQDEERLYSGSIKSPKELEDLQHSIESLKRHRSALEDDVLEVMLGLEDAREEQNSAETDLQTIEEAWHIEQADLRQEQDELARQLHELITLRGERAKLVQGKMLARYEAIAKRKGGVGITRTQYGKCMSCRVSIPENKVRSARQGNLETCSSCGRIINPM